MKRPRSTIEKLKVKIALLIRRSRVMRLLLGQRLRPVLVLAMLGFIMFGAFRAGLLAARYRPIIEDLNATDVWHCFVLGLRFDAVPIGCAILPLGLALALAPRRFFRLPTFRAAVVAYATTLVVLAVGVEIIGAAFFLHFRDRLNWMAIAHFGHFQESAFYIWKTYPVITFFVTMTCLALFVRWGFSKLFWAWPTPLRISRFGQVAMALVLAAICVIMCRGGLGGQPIGVGRAYFSTDKVLCRLALNNFFTLFHAARVTLTDVGDETEYYSFPSVARAAEVAGGMLIQRGETPLGGEANPLWRRSDAGKPRRNYNVVVILMESMAGRCVGALGNSTSFTPELDALCKEGIFFDRFYAVGNRTSRGVVGTLCGHPDISGVSILRRDLAIGNFLTLPAILRSRGYATMFIYGGDPAFDNMREFLAKGGIDKFYSQADMGDPCRAGNWGVPDEMTFENAHKVFLSMGSKKFFAAILTVTNHTPYEVPAGRIEMLLGQSDDIKALNAMRYSDWALGQFFRKARKADYFKNTIFVLVADHGRDLDDRRIVDVPDYRIPCLFYAPDIIQPQRIRTVASQVDIPPTILSLLGGTYEHCFMGRNILDVSENDGFAVIHDDDLFAFVRGDLALVVPPRHDGILFRVTGNSMEIPSRGEIPSQDVQMLNLQMLSYYMMARHLYLTCSYRPPAASAVANTGGPSAAVR